MAQKCTGMNRGLLRRVERLEVAKRTLDVPNYVVIYMDEHGRVPTGPVPTRPDGLPIPVIILPSIVPLKEEEIQDMALPAPKKR